MVISQRTWAVSYTSFNQKLDISVNEVFGLSVDNYIADINVKSVVDLSL